ncbi:MAG: acyltransferase family protein [Lactobacillus sp.]|nr:acyltransferase family protein [Lactobacillus sp.]
MTIGGKVGVDVFVMIGSYFLIDKSFKFKRIVKLTLMIVFYTWVIYAILKLSNYNLQYQWYELWLPVPGTYWFAGSYIVLLFITPVLNLVIENITQEQYRNILYFLTLIFVLIPTFIILNIIDLGLSHSELGNSTVSTFVYLYLLIGYIRKYPNKFTNSIIDNLLFLMLGIMMSGVFLGLGSIYWNDNQQIPVYVMNSLSSNSFFVVWISLGLILVFKNIPPFTSRIINIVAGGTFAVYLIHDNQFIRGILWGKVNNFQYQSSSNFLIHGLEVSLLTLVICIVIELVRQIFFNRIFGIIEEKLGDLLSKKLGSKKDY